MLVVGHPIMLEYKGKRIKSFLRGWKVQKNGYLLTDPPGMEDARYDLQAGANIIVRMEGEGTIYGFITEFVASLDKTKLLVLKLSEDIHEYSLRDTERYPCLIPVKIDSAESSIEGMICDISNNGVRLLTKEPVHDTDSMLISFSLCGAGSIESQRIKVMRNSRVGRMHEYAGSFLGIRPNDKQKLEDYFNFYREWMPAQ